MFSYKKSSYIKHKKRIFDFLTSYFHFKLAGGVVASLVCGCINDGVDSPEERRSRILVARDERLRVVVVLEGGVGPRDSHLVLVGLFVLVRGARENARTLSIWE